MKANEFAKRFGWEKSKMAVKKLLPMEDGMPVFDYNSEDLKRLVESYELVESYGGVSKAKADTRLLTCFGDNDFFREVTLKKSIVDVESCNENPN